jgi:phage terminase large subunit
VKGNLSKNEYQIEFSQIVKNICSLISSSDAVAMERQEKPSTNSNEVVETLKTYRLGDKFIFKTFRDKNITKAQAKKILEGGTVKLKLKSKGGKDYEMKVFLKDGKLEGEF